MVSSIIKQLRQVLYSFLNRLERSDLKKSSFWSDPGIFHHLQSVKLIWTTVSFLGGNLYKVGSGCHVKAGACILKISQIVVIKKNLVLFFHIMLYFLPWIVDMKSLTLRVNQQHMQKKTGFWIIVLCNSEVQ